MNKLHACMQMVVVVDADLASEVLGNGEGLNKALEPDLSDKLMSHGGHRTMFSADTNSHYWRLIRKGAAPAFITKNIKCAALAPLITFTTTNHH
jgi:cytochrome P450